MLFDIDGDDGARVTGWIVPDHPSAEPAVIVDIDGQDRRRVAATRFRPALQQQGLHATGLCGFVLDALSCPGLRPGLGLRVFDEGSNVLLYRRATSATVPLRLFHLEAEPVPVLHGLRGFFQLSYGSMELLGEESVVSAISAGFTGSIFVSGAMTYLRYEAFLTGAGYRRTVLLGDPSRVLAAKLLHLQRLGRQEGAAAGWRSLGAPRLVAALAERDLADPFALALALDGLDEDDLRGLAEPTTRMLSTRHGQDRLDPDRIGAALDALADFDLIGFDDELDVFLDGIETLTGRRLADPPRTPPELDAVAFSVDACGTAQRLVELDRELVSLAREAIDRSATMSGRA